MILLKQAKEELACVADGGMSSSDPRLPGLIKRAVDRVKDELCPKGTYARCTLNTWEGCLVLPREIETLILWKSCDNRVTRPPANMWFEFMPGTNGPWRGYAPASRLLSRGESAVWKEPDPKDPTRLLVFSSEPEDEDATITIKGYSGMGSDTTGPTGPGETLSIQYYTGDGTPEYTKFDYSKVVAVNKSVTNGFVYLCQYNPHDHMHRQIAIYHPSDISPTFSVYAVPKNVNRIDAVVKKRSLNLVHDTDEVIIDNMAALRLVLQMLHAEVQQDMSLAAGYQLQAVNLLSKQVQWTEGFEPILNVDPIWMGGGYMENLV